MSLEGEHRPPLPLGAADPKCCQVYTLEGVLEMLSRYTVCFNEHRAYTWRGSGDTASFCI